MQAAPAGYAVAPMCIGGAPLRRSGGHRNRIKGFRRNYSRERCFPSAAQLRHVVNERGRGYGCACRPRPTGSAIAGTLQSVLDCYGWEMGWVGPMRWVRSNSRFGAWLALAALALRLAVSFGHVHLNGAPPAAVVDATAAAPGSTPPPDQQPGNHTDDYCAICATIHLAASAFVPSAPQVEAPFASQPIEHIDHVTIAFVSARRAPFQSRAPPLA